MNDPLVTDPAGLSIVPIEVSAVRYEDLRSSEEAESSEAIRERVVAARKRQQETPGDVLTTMPDCESNPAPKRQTC